MNQIDRDSQDSIDLLSASFPFSSEPLELISENSDFVDFLSYFTIYFGEEESTLFRHYLEENRVTQAGLHNVYGTFDMDLYKKIVDTTKHIFVYLRMLTGLGSQDMLNANELPYIYESESDFECSLLLFTSGKFHKQSIQMLRNAIEVVVIHSYFSFERTPYDDLKLRKIPSMSSTRSGMLKKLNEVGLINDTLRDEIVSLYASLSNSTHSQFSYLNTKFEEDNFQERLNIWASLAQATAIACTKLALANLKLIQQESEY